MKKLITLFSVLLLLFSCSKEETETSEVQFSVVAQGDHFDGNYDAQPENLVIKDETSWNSLKAKMSDYSVSTFDEPKIDFTKYEVIAVFDKIQLYGGYSIDVTDIIENENLIFVKVENLNPGGLSAVITQPYHIIKIQKSNKPVVFE